MNRKIEDIFNKLSPKLEEVNIRKITSSVGIKNHGKNPTPEQEAGLEAICQLIATGESVELAISKVAEPDSSPKPNSNDTNLEKIILEQANKAADAALFSLPNVALAETEQLRQAFIQQFRSRVEEQLRSPEFQQQFISQMECLGELRASSSNMMNTATLDSSSSSS